ncbi:MAG: archease [Actinobacteria bacterium]|nr:archease [Actinomycetota bacterium]MBU1943603.1 archease [Actinomycetota bacterium]MBU2688936.1 archease [Actinomycetota bacterium]
MECRIVEHTADIGIHVEADGADELFEGAAAGMFSIITDTSAVADREATEVSLEAGDTEGLMFKWLNELLYLADSRNVLFSRFEVSGVEAGRLHATAYGEGFDPARHTMNSEVKAATYHDLAVGREGGVWTATVIFDV